MWRDIIVGSRTIRVHDSGDVFAYTKRGYKKLRDTVAQGYIRNMIDGKNYARHRLVYHAFNPSFSLDSPLFIDHINRIPYDNRLANLRVATRGENCRNSCSRGMSKRKNIRAVNAGDGWGWRVDISLDGSVHSRYFPMDKTERPDLLPAIPDEVVQFRNKRLKELHGEFACYD